MLIDCMASDETHPFAVHPPPLGTRALDVRNSDENDVAAILAEEATTLLPFGDVPFYEDGLDRAYVLQRFVHCNEMMKRVPELQNVDRTWWCINYAMQPNALDELATEMNNNLLVSALLVTISLAMQFEGWVFETHPDLMEPFLIINSITSVMYMIEIFLGVVLYEQLFRRPIGSLPCYVQFIKFNFIYYTWWNSVFAAVIMHILGICIATYGEQSEKVGIVTVVGAGLGMLLFSLSFFVTYDSTSRNQHDTATRFRKAYLTPVLSDHFSARAGRRLAAKEIASILCFPVAIYVARRRKKQNKQLIVAKAIDPLTCGDLKPEWRQWLADQIKSRNE